MSDKYAQIYSPTQGDFSLPGLLLTEAYNVCVKQRINAEWSVSLDVPRVNTEQWKLIKNRAVVRADGQLYIIKFVEDGVQDGKPYRHAEGRHIFWDVCQRKHIPKTTFIGVPAYDVLYETVMDVQYRGNYVYHYYNSDVEQLGMTLVQSPVDIEKFDKKNPLEIMQAVIQQVGGEPYIDNFNFALVEQLGQDTAMVFKLNDNLKNYSATYEDTETVTRLYPYGASSLEIGIVNGEEDYIDSDNYDSGDPAEGFIDLTRYKDPETLLERARKEFDPDNYYRIDRPRVSYRINAVDLWKLVDLGTLPVSPDAARLNLGDYARIVDEVMGIDARVRVVGQDIYPYEPTQSVITLGDPPKTILDIVTKADSTSGNYYSKSYDFDIDMPDMDEILTNVGDAITEGAIDLFPTIVQAETFMAVLLDHPVNADDVATFPEDADVLFGMEYDPATALTPEPSAAPPVGSEGDYNIMAVGRYEPRWTDTGGEAANG